MSTPTKRRKTNGYNPSPQTVGSLDFFFGKQKAESKPRAQEGEVRNDSDDPTSLSQEEDANKLDDHTLTDEELARKLQLEWDQQDNISGEIASKKPKEINPDAPPVPKDDDSKQLNGDFLTRQGLFSNVTPAVESFGSQSKSKNSVGPGKKATLSLQSAASAEDAVSSSVPFDENPLIFDPGKYLPALKSHWAKEDGDASYGLLTKCFILVNSTQSRIKIVDTLVNFLRTLIEGNPESLLPAVGLCTLCNLSEPLLIHSRYGLRRTQSLLPISPWSLV